MIDFNAFKSQMLSNPKQAAKWVGVLALIYLVLAIVGQHHVSQTNTPEPAIDSDLRSGRIFKEGSVDSMMVRAEPESTNPSETLSDRNPWMPTLILLSLLVGMYMLFTFLKKTSWREKRSLQASDQASSFMQVLRHQPIPATNGNSSDMNAIRVGDQVFIVLFTPNSSPTVLSTYSFQEWTDLTNENDR